MSRTRTETWRALFVLWPGLLLPATLLAPAPRAASAEPVDVRDAADTPAAAIDLAEDIRPIFVMHCYQCHGPDSQDGGIRWDRRASAIAGGDSGVPAIVPGKPDNSELVQRIMTTDEDEQMPPPDEGTRLSPDQIAKIQRWIRAGATWPADAAETRHWSYTMPVRSPLPEIKQKPWPRNAIDHFVLARLEAAGLAPSAPADRARLLRRVYLDLVGLPPSPDEVQSFLNDASPDAYENAVDRLLASSAYGEKWARHWLDLARYADSNGYQADQIRESWAYRDWVIAAMNADMPFDQFTIEQIAGDLLPEPTPEQRIATGFHRTPTCNVEAGVDPEENRTNQVIDRVNTTGTVWLGTTLECAQCHNHKYDPFTQKDYYQLFAFFNNTPLEVVNGNNGVRFDFFGPKMDIPMAPDEAERQAALRQQIDRGQQELQQAIKAAEAEQPVWEARLARGGSGGPQSHVLDIATFHSSGGSTHRVQDDKSVLIGGQWPSNDTYTITVDTDLTDITGFKVEALTDASLPQSGPGRGDTPNIVLNELTITTHQRGADPKGADRVALHSAVADFSQRRWDVAGAIDGKPTTGWAIAPQFGKPHHASFQAAKPVGYAGGTTLTFTLVQNFGRTRTIGRLRLSALTGGGSGELMGPDIAAILAKPAAKRTAKAKKKLRDFYLGQRSEINKLRADMERLKKQLGTIKPRTTLVMVEMDKPRSTHIFKRGVFLDKGLQVSPDVPGALHAFPSDAPRNRLGMARWLVARENPLVARVTINRWWAEIFGHGLVRSAEDFGTQGDPPSHPQLLDWLALEFMDSGWSMKRMHKLIVTSATYRQSSRVTPKLLAQDFQNVLLARGPRFRLPAEVMRDNALQVSGLLSTKMGGPPVFPPQPPGLWRQTGRNEPKYVVAKNEDRYRRGVYVIWRRVAPYPSFVNFDAPDRTRCFVQRSKTNTPLQALTLLNDEAYVECAKALAARIITDRPEANVRERIGYAIQLCVARAPSAAEIDYLENVYRSEVERFATDAAAARTLIGDLKLPAARKTPQDLQQWAAWFCIANILLNLDETISKG